MTGYDLDGTICSKMSYNISYFKANRAERRAIDVIKEIHYRAAKLILTPLEKEYVIITSRKPKHSTITFKWLKKATLEPKEIYFMGLSRTRNNMIEYKSNKINELGLKKYYEDDSKIARALRKKCPSTEVIEVEPIIEIYLVKNFINDCLQF